MRICILIKYIILNNFRELKQIIITKFNIRDNLAEKIVQSYYLFGFMFGILIAYFSMYSKLAQVYFLGINSWIIISLPKYDIKIRYIILINQLVKRIIFIPVILISLFMNPILSIAILFVSIIINKFIYYKIISIINSEYVIYFLIINTLSLFLLDNAFIIGLFLAWISFLLLIPYFRISRSIYKKIIMSGIISFLILLLVKKYTFNYDKYDLILVVVYLALLTKNSILCQQEQFLNVNKLLMNLEFNVDEKIEVLCKYNYKIITLFIFVYFPLTFLFIYYKINNILYTSLLSVLISILQYMMYFNFLLYATFKFMDSKILIYNESDFMSFRFSPLFVLASLPLVSVYYLYKIFELKITVILAILIFIFILTSYLSKLKFKKLLLNILEE